MVTLKKAPKPKRVKAFRPNPRRAPQGPRIQKTTQKQGFSFLPEAAAIGNAPLIFRAAVIGGKKILQTMPQRLSGPGLRVNKRTKNIKKSELDLMTPGMVRTNGKPPIVSSPKGFFQAKKRVKKVPNFNKYQSGTRLDQSDSLLNLNPLKHKVTPTQFTKIIPGGPRHLKGGAYTADAFGRSKTQYDKTQFVRTESTKRLIKGVSPTPPPPAPGDKLAHSAYIKFIDGDKKPERVFQQKTLFGAAGASVTAAPLYDQVNSFFNPFPEAHATSGAAVKVGLTAAQKLVQVVAIWLKANPKGTYRGYLGSTNTRGNKELKNLFQQQKKLNQQQQQVVSQNPGTVLGPGPTVSDKSQLKNLGFSIAGFGGLAGAAVVVNESGVLDQGPMDPTLPVVVLPEQEHTPSSVVPPGHEYDTLVPLTATDLMSQNKSLQEMQDAKMLGLQSAAATGSDAVPGGVVDPWNKGWTQVTYDRYVPQEYASDHEKAGQRKKGTVEEYSQWMRFTKGFTEAQFLASQASVLKNKQQSDTHHDLLTTLGKIDPNTGTGMRDKALAAQKFYQDNPTMGRLPAQWNIILDATKPSSQDAYDEAWKQHKKGDEGKGYITSQTFFPDVYPEGHPKAGQAHPKAGEPSITSTASGFPYAVPLSSPPRIGDENAYTSKKYYPTDPDHKDYVKGNVGQVMPTNQYWLNYATPTAVTTPPPETEIPGTTLSATSPSAANTPITTHVPEKWMTATDDKGVSVASTLTGLQNNNPQFEAVQEWDGGRYVFDGVNWWPEDQYITIRNTATS